MNFLGDEMFDGAVLLITGGTGSFGQRFVETTLEKYNPSKIIIYSRDEMKQWNMKIKFGHDERLRFFIGDVRDLDRLKMALRGVDFVVHAAATKIVPTAEYDPFECIKTNINGAMNIIHACLESAVQKVVALSTDKASAPSNLYGATKLASDKLFIAGNSYVGGGSLSFSVVRYGNVMGSRGSVIPFFLNLKKGMPTPITHVDMTRFMITLDQGVELVYDAFNESKGGEIFVKKIPSMRIVDVAAALRPDADFVDVGVRAGEKLHEQMIGIEDTATTYEYSDYYKILPALFDWDKDAARIGGGVKVADNFSYSSDNNTHWMTAEELRGWVHSHGDRMLEI